MYIYPFEKLDVWQLSKDLVLKIYKNTESFPEKKKFGMVSQMRRAALSVCSNLAEDAARNSGKDQANFYGIAYGSLLELLNQLLICVDLNWLLMQVLTDLRTDIEKISFKINALLKAALQQSTKISTPQHLNPSTR
jgi:four helix bundle protein